MESRAWLYGLPSQPTDLLSMAGGLAMAYESRDRYGNG
jgi:hypothetical protein